MNKKLRSGMILRTKKAYASLLVDKRVIEPDVFLLIVSDVYIKKTSVYLDVMLDGIVEKWQRRSEEELYKAIERLHEIIGE